MILPKQLSKFRPGAEIILSAGSRKYRIESYPFKLYKSGSWYIIGRTKGYRSKVCIYDYYNKQICDSIQFISP